MRRLPLISVVITTYGQEKFIGQTVESVLQQGIDDLELIILDDCSPDATAQAVEPYLDDHRVEYIRHERNIGDKENNRLALSLATGKYQAWLHGDDYFLPGHLAQGIDILERHPECALVYSPCYWVDASDRVIKLARHPGHVDFDYAGGRNEVAELLAKDNYITPSAAIFRRADLEQIDNLKREIKASDWDLFVRLAIHNSNFAYLNTPSTAYRITAAQGSRSFYASVEPLRTHLHVLETAFQSPAAVRLRETAGEMAEHLERRIAQYPAEDIEAFAADIARVRQLLENAECQPESTGPGSQGPLVSVIVPTLNRPELLQDTLRSLNEQSYANWEAVIVNDGGEDVSALVRALDHHGRFRYLQHASSCGLSSARNTGIRFSHGDILCYLDDDDRFKPDHLETVVAALQQGENAFVYTDADYVLEECGEDGRRELQRAQPYAGITFSLQRLHVSNFIPVNTWAHRRELLAHTGFFDTGLNALEDWDMLLRMSQHTPFQHLPGSTVEVRVRAGQGSEHMTRRERQDYPELFKRIYARYPVDDNATLQEARRMQLSELESECKAGEVARDAAVTVDARELPLLRREVSYAQWRELNRLTDNDVSLLEERLLNAWQATPAVQFVLLDPAGSQEQLGHTLSSVSAQLYSAWGLSVISPLDARSAEFETADNLEWIRSDELELALQAVIDESTTQWLCFLSAGDLLETDFLVRLLDHADTDSYARVVYPDQDCISADGELYNPQFRPDMDSDLLYSTDFLGNACLLDTSLVQASCRRRPVRDAGFLHEAFLSLLREAGEGAFLHTPRPLFHAHDANRHYWYSPQAQESRTAQLQAHLEVSGLSARVHAGYLPVSNRVEYLHPRQPLVSIIVPTRDALDVLRTCVDTLLGKTAYSNYELIIVDNNSERAETREYLAALAADEARVQVLSYPGEYNYSAINNHAAASARGEYLVLLNNDTAVLKEDWLQQMLSPAMRADTAIVGARLLFPDNSLQHAGIVTGMSAAADHPHIGLPASESGYMGQVMQMRGVSAVTGACLMIRKEVFDSLGGLDEQRFAVLYNDVDLCLRARQAGFRVVYTPYAVLMHHGSFSLRQAQKTSHADPARKAEHLALLDAWLPQMARDRFYNPNLSLSDNSVQIESQVRTAWDTCRHDRQRVLAFPPDAWAVGDYRVQAPLDLLERQGRIVYSAMPHHAGEHRCDRPLQVAELQRMEPDVLLMHQALHDYHLEGLEQYARYNSGVLRVFGMDDLLVSPPPGHRLNEVGYRDIKRRVRKALSLCDRLVVSTPVLAEACRGMIDDIRVVPNSIDVRRWTGLESSHRSSPKCRVGWAGGHQHAIDLQILAPVIEQLGGEVEWVFFGSQPPGADKLPVEFHPAVTYEQYPRKLASLKLDLALAPLSACAFNEAKSNLRVLEFGMLGIPVICSDIEPFRGAPVTRVSNTVAAWSAAIREYAHDPRLREKQGAILKAWVLAGYTLDQHAAAWYDALGPHGDDRSGSLPVPSSA